MKKLLFAGAAALLLTGAMADPSFAAMRGGGKSAGGAHISGGGGSYGGGGRVGGNFSASTAPRAAVTRGSFNRGGTYAGRTGRPGFAGRSAAVGGRGGHWVWRNHHRVFVPFAVGVGVGLGFSDYGWGDDCVVWNGWRWVNTCVGPYASGYGPGWGGPGWGGPGWGGPGWGGPGWW